MIVCCFPFVFCGLGGKEEREERGEGGDRQEQKKKLWVQGFVVDASPPKVREDAYVSPTLIGRVCAGDYTTVRRLESVPMQ